MIVLTGAAGFIGSCMLSRLNQEGYRDIVIVDDFTKTEKISNYNSKIFTKKVDRKLLIPWLKKNQRWIQFVIHIGARTDTMEYNPDIFDELNLNYSKSVWNVCAEFGIPLIYASSAATYGDGSLGYDDNHEIIPKLKPLNAYGVSKNQFDIWALQQVENGNQPGFWAGFKFFNVYGPNEYHKGRMASVIMHAHKQIREHKYMTLFRSHRNDYKDGEQRRDFIYVKDVCDVLLHFMETRKHSGIYNLGTGQSRTFYDLAKACFSAMNLPEDIRFVDTPQELRDKYQYFTEANMQKLRNAGYDKAFTELETGVNDYIQEYLDTQARY
ncbi:MAG: ADP-glyceromanno-heptose 6-epimerase [Cyclobacterium sp.]|uniref:ADP-glyceromanno-heptose 6-epimerase n=1 Tax=Cyclobacterium sp. TaxID=1966343 RepID=UPI0039707EA9